MKIEEIVSDFKKHQLQYGLNGDSGLKELYKWELVAKQLGHPDTDAVDFANEIYSVQLQNLCYPPQITAYRNFAKYAPEDYRKALRMLFTETVDLQERVDSFTSTCKALWDNKIKSHFEQNTSAMCDERLISCFLTLKYPQKYTFYKSDVYSSLCNILGVESKKAGYKLVHFYELLNKYVVPVVENDKELMDSISKEIDNKGYIHSTLLIAQTALWYYVCKSGINQSGINYWLLGHAFGRNNPQYERFIFNGIWEGGFDIRKPVDQRQMSLARKIKIGDIVLLKSTATKGVNHDIPFLRIKAIGIVESEINEIDNGDSHLFKCEVKYLSTNDKDFEGASYGAYRQTVHEADEKVRAVIEYANSVINQNDNPMKKYSKYIELLKENHNLVLTGAPGTGKTFMAQAIAEEMGCGKDEMCFVQFHPSYDYTDFVEGLRPIEKSDGQVGFERKDGVFKEFCKKAVKNIVDSEKNVDFVFIIDEINRGEASKIFGELFYAIDPGYRGKSDVRVKTQYQNLIPESDVFADGFYVPDNVYIIGTMNDIDRSVESMDFAMRRRFTWKEVTPTETQSMLDTLPCADEAKKTMNRLNEEIANTDGLGTAYMVGPAYFLKLGNNGGDFLRLWDMNIEPLLKEYLRGFRKSDDILKKFSKVYFNSEETPTEQEESEELE